MKIKDNKLKKYMKFFWLFFENKNLERLNNLFKSMILANPKINIEIKLNK